jgi:hypothetical protein
MSLEVLIDLFGDKEIEMYYQKNLNKLKQKIK